jgi:uncharacterized protein YceK
MRTLLISLALCVMMSGCAEKTAGVRDYGDFEDSTNQTSSAEKGTKFANVAASIGAIALDILLVK